MSTINSLPILKVQKVGAESFEVNHCVWANSLMSRLKGLLGKDHLQENEGLLLDPCNQVHMFFMNMAIDAIFLDSENRIVAVESLKPWRLSKLYFKAKKVLELQYGLAEKAGWKVGDKLQLITDSRGQS
jgi:uncharacterized membrane protein (UPF0127 family)